MLGMGTRFFGISTVNNFAKNVLPSFFILEYYNDLKCMIKSMEGERVKKILIVHAGGTIGCFAKETAREMNRESTSEMRQLLVENFKNSSSRYVKHYQLLVASDFSWEYTTLSESMTLEKLNAVIKYIRNVPSDNFSGIIVLHGTDTLAFSAAMLSVALSDTKIPIIMVSGNRPPSDPLSNANDNFTAAVQLIWDNIAPNVYVTYRNADSIVRLYLASAIMQSENYTDDFRSASADKVFDLNATPIDEALTKCLGFSENRKSFPLINIDGITEFSEQVLLIKPYTGLRYSLYKDCFNNENPDSFKAVVHGTYHSGTVSWPGLVLSEEARRQRESNNITEAEHLEAAAKQQANSPQSFKYLADICENRHIPLFIAPSFLGSDQYKTMNVVSANTNAQLLNITTEMTFAKLTVALSCNLTEDEISEYMNFQINNEYN